MQRFLQEHGEVQLSALGLGELLPAASALSHYAAESPALSVHPFMIPFSRLELNGKRGLIVTKMQLQPDPACMMFVCPVWRLELSGMPGLQPSLRW